MQITTWLRNMVLSRHAAMGTLQLDLQLYMRLDVDQLSIRQCGGIQHGQKFQRGTGIADTTRKYRFYKTRKMTVNCL